MTRKALSTAVVGTVIVALSAGAQPGRTRPTPATQYHAGLPVWLCVGPATVERNQEIGGLVAFGPVTIAGKVDGDVTSFGGPVNLRRTAVVAGHVTAVCAEIDLARGARVAGEVNARQLPEMAAVDIASGRARLAFGDTEIRRRDEPPTDLVVVGGKVTLRKGCRLGSVVAIGGDVKVEQGAELGVARVVGGQLTRPGKKASSSDEVMEPLTMVCAGSAATDGAAAGWTTSSMRWETGNMRFAAQPDPEWRSAFFLQIDGGDLRVVLTPQIAAVTRRPSPRPERAGSFGHGPGPEWLTGPPYVSAADSAVATSTAVGAGVRLQVDYRGRAGGAVQGAERTVTLAVPASAARLVGSGYRGAGPGAHGGRSPYGGGRSSGPAGRW